MIVVRGWIVTNVAVPFLTFLGVSAVVSDLLDFAFLINPTRLQIGSAAALSLLSGLIGAVLVRTLFLKYFS